MSFPRYPRYKGSGVEWLGEVPEHWSVMRLRHALQLNPSKSELAALDGATLVSFLPMEAIGEDGSLTLDRERPISELAGGYSYFRDGDVAIAKITPCFENGKGALMRELTNGAGFGTTELIVARPRLGAVIGEYLQLIFSSVSFRQLGEAEMYGAGGQKRVPDDFVRDFTIALPPVDEQERIAGTLNAERAKIDTLITEQQHLIELLQEKRQATITRAVTKGLNPNAPMKPSGVDWPGDVPVHWDVTRLGRKIELQRGVDITKEQQTEGDVPVVSSGGITSYHNEALIRGPGVVVGRKGTAGSLFYVESDFWPHDTTLYVRDFRGNHPKYVYYKLLALDLASFDTGSSNPTINRNLVHPTLVSWPPVREQIEIAKYLNCEGTVADSLIEQVEHAIAALRERRSTLISAAVTGKIDVRGLVSADADAA